MSQDLKAGKKYAMGIIVGKWGQSKDALIEPPSGEGVFTQVLYTLRRRHAGFRNPTPMPGTFCEADVQSGRTCAPLRTASGGVLLRVLSGEGQLLTDVEEKLDFEYGDWAYIPPGLVFQIKSRRGRLRFARVTLKVLQ